MNGPRYRATFTFAGGPPPWPPGWPAHQSRVLAALHTGALGWWLWQDWTSPTTWELRLVARDLFALQEPHLYEEVADWAAGPLTLAIDVDFDAVVGSPVSNCALTFRANDVAKVTAQTRLGGPAWPPFNRLLSQRMTFELHASAFGCTLSGPGFETWDHDALGSHSSLGPLTLADYLAGNPGGQLTLTAYPPVGGAPAVTAGGWHLLYRRNTLWRRLSSDGAWQPVALPESAALVWHQDLYHRPVPVAAGPYVALKRVSLPNQPGFSPGWASRDHGATWVEAARPGAEPRPWSAAHPLLAGFCAYDAFPPLDALLYDDRDGWAMAVGYDPTASFERILVQPPNDWPAVVADPVRGPADTLDRPVPFCFRHGDGAAAVGWFVGGRYREARSDDGLRTWSLVADVEVGPPALLAGTGYWCAPDGCQAIAGYHQRLGRCHVLARDGADGVWDGPFLELAAGTACAPWLLQLPDGRWECGLPLGAAPAAWPCYRAPGPHGPWTSV